jgi:hypothetical protein
VIAAAQRIKVISFFMNTSPGEKLRAGPKLFGYLQRTERSNFYGDHSYSGTEGSTGCVAARGPLLDFDAAGPAQLTQRPVLKRRKNSGGMPVAQPAPTRHAADTEDLAGEFLPADARLQHEDDAAQTGGDILTEMGKFC